MLLKWIKRLAIVAVLLAILGYFGITRGVNSLVKSGVEKGGSHLTDVPVTLDQVSLALSSGGGSLTGLRIANPEPFKSESAISVQNASISVAPSTLMSSKVVIHTLKLEQPAVTYERTLSSSNLDKIMEAIQTKVPASDAESEEIRFQIDDFQMLQAQVTLSATALGGKGVQFTLPDIVLKDLGKEGPGVTGAELAKEIMGALLSGVVDQAAGQGISGLTDALKGTLKQEGDSQAGDAASNLMKNVQSIFQSSSEEDKK